MHAPVRDGTGRQRLDFVGIHQHYACPGILSIWRSKKPAKSLT
jgi:hypothetical protein